MVRERGNESQGCRGAWGVRRIRRDAALRVGGVAQIQEGGSSHGWAGPKKSGHCRHEEAKCSEIGGEESQGVNRRGMLEFEWIVRHVTHFGDFQGRYEGDPKPQDHEKPFYPKYAEYEVMPGEKEVENYDKWKEFKNPYHKKPEEKPWILRAS